MDTHQHYVGDICSHGFAHTLYRCEISVLCVSVARHYYNRLVVLYAFGSKICAGEEYGRKCIATAGFGDNRKLGAELAHYRIFLTNACSHNDVVGDAG